MTNKHFVYLDVEQIHSPVNEHQETALAVNEEVLSHGFL
jgi:hypothetical protein